MALESVQWVLTLLNSVNDLAAMLGKTHAALPEEFRQKLPKLFGLTLDDERIFWGVVASIDDPQKRIAIGDFLATCKDFERNRFVNIVAGMEITPGKPAESEEKFDPKTGNQTYKKTKAGSVGLDLRKRFLESFADDIIKQNFRNMDEAYEYCVSGRMILPNPLHQKALKAFSGSTKEFKKFVLEPFGATSLKELPGKLKEAAGEIGKKVKNQTDATLTKVEGVAVRRRDEFNNRPMWKKIFKN
ncbi:MAG: hypothetical protein HGA61_03115 [Candidatus Moranbacteria bacterium]|nr:hypothetical protein [Candidatus Moranbacteria bacterium]